MTIEVRTLTTTMALAVFLAGPASTTHAQAIADYHDLAAIVSEPVFDEASLNHARDAYSDGGVMSLREYQRQRLAALRRLDGAGQAAREKIEQSLGKCYGTYQEIRRLDRSTPDYEGIVKGAISATPALLKEQKDRSANDSKAIDALAFKVIREAGSALANAYQLSSERDKYRQHYASSRSTMREAMESLARRCHKASERRPAEKTLTIAAVSPSLANTYLNDSIKVRNDSGKDLLDCTLLVNLRGIHAVGGAADVDRHFHFVSYWPAGESRYVWYPSRSLRGIATGESVDVIRKVEVDLFCDQFATTATYELAGKRYDAQVKKWAAKHLKPASFTGRWHTDEENLIDPAGFAVTYKGDLGRFTVDKVTVEATQGDRTVRASVAGPAWDFSQKKWICHRDFNPLNPTRIKVIIAFPGTSYEHVLSWKR